MILFYGIIFLFANKKNKKRIFLTCPSGEQRVAAAGLGGGGIEQPAENIVHAFLDGPEGDGSLFFEHELDLVAGMQVESIPPFLGDRLSTDIAPQRGLWSIKRRSPGGTASR